MNEPLTQMRRLLRMVLELQSGQRLHTRQLAEACGVSRRTIFRDLRTLQECGFPVQYDAERQGYFLPHRT